jgi:hypothetical protein
LAQMIGVISRIGHDDLGGVIPRSMRRLAVHRPSDLR